MPGKIKTSKHKNQACLSGGCLTFPREANGVRSILKEERGVGKVLASTCVISTKLLENLKECTQAVAREAADAAVQSRRASTKAASTSAPAKQTAAGGREFMMFYRLCLTSLYFLGWFPCQAVLWPRTICHVSRIIVAGLCQHRYYAKLCLDLSLGRSLLFAASSTWEHLIMLSSIKHCYSYMIAQVEANKTEKASFAGRRPPR